MPDCAQLRDIKLDPREKHFRIAGPGKLNLFLRYMPPAAPTAGGSGPIVLYVHGATFPSGLSIAHRFDCCGAKPRSWRDALCDSGFHVWGLDFLGFGESDRYPEMTKPAEAMPPLCRADDAAEQIAAAARFILEQHEARHLSIIAHSWGTIAACRFASRHPASIGRLVLFGPIGRRDLAQEEPSPRTPAWRLITLEAQWNRFVEDVPAREQPVLSRAHFGPWGEAYLDSDPGSREREPASVKVPAGPAADIARAWRGDFPYDPADVTAPVAIIRGAWDGVCNDADARWLFERFGSAMKQDIKIGRATHLMHLEAMRHALYRASIAFLSDDNF